MMLPALASIVILPTVPRKIDIPGKHSRLPRIRVPNQEQSSQSITRSSLVSFSAFGDGRICSAC